MSGRGVHNREKTHCPAGHEYTEDNVYRFVSRGGYLSRRCKTCCLASSRARRGSQ
jgi:hypothetical protein